MPDIPVLVVGAGIAGLRVGAHYGDRCVVLEQKPHVGGRIRSVYEENGTLAYEAGPWRVAASHARVRRLCDAHGVALLPCPTPPLRETHMERRGGLTTWGANAVQHGVVAANHLDLKTGYMGETHSASGSAPYQTAHNDTFLVAPAGLSVLAERLAQQVNVRTNTSVVDIVRCADTYVVHTRTRLSSGAFRKGTYTCRALFTCVPPNVSSRWSAFRDLGRAVVERVESAALHHVYCKGEAMRPFHRYDKDGILGQTIASQYANEWFQASYSSGAIAELWNNLRFENVRACVSLLRTRLQALGIAFRRQPRFHYWDTAFHKWHPVPGFHLATAVAQCVEWNAVHLPRAYNVGEAFSSHQAWMEGALETADIAIALCDSGEHALPFRCKRAHEIVMDGRIIDPSRFLEAHPGGREALLNHLGEADIRPLFEHIGHSQTAWRVLGSLQVAWTERPKDSRATK